MESRQPMQTEQQKAVIAVQISDSSVEGRVFEGIGGITSNGMSKLLMDYPAQQRDEIMDLLFKPNYGASLQHLKVELGSDVNTSCGTEPSHMRSRADFDITRGYGLPIAKLAKAVNPELMLDALRWGTPRWIRDDNDKLEYYLSFLRGARDVYGLEFDYLGPDINEGAFSRDWTVKTLKPGLDREGFGHIKLVADDSEHGWDIADRAAVDPELFEIVHAYGVHYTQKSTDTAKESGKQLWLSEDLAPFRHSFSAGALHIGKRIIDMYVSGRMVKYEIHPLLEAEYENTPFNYKGMLVATWPWSGHYRIDPGLWVIAHFSQFMKPGWVYMDDACGQTPDGGHVTLRDRKTGGISIVIVNNGPEEWTYSFKLPPAVKKLYVWRTNELEHFQQMSDFLLYGSEDDGTAAIKVQSYSIYTLTTTAGQRKGSDELTIPESTEFPLPYRDSLTSGRLSGNPKYTSDQGGAFEYVPSEEGDGSLRLKQLLTLEEIPIDWTYRKTPEPYTLLGSLEWTNYRVSVEARLEAEQGYISLGGRINNTDKSYEPPDGYLFVAHSNGRCELRKRQMPVAYAAIEPLQPFEWHKIELVFAGTTISVLWDGEPLLETVDSDIPSGHIALASSYHRTAFRNLAVEPVDETTPVHCVRYDDKHPSLRYEGEWTRADGDFNVYARSLTKSEEAGAEMSFRFTGSAVNVICKKAPDGGFADVYLDGEYQGTVDTYQPSARFRKTLYGAHNLDPDKSHELMIMVKGIKHPESAGTYVYMDAIEVVG